MYRRPKPGEDDLEAMIQEFDKEKNVQLAATVVQVKSFFSNILIRFQD